MLQHSHGVGPQNMAETLWIARTCLQVSYFLFVLSLSILHTSPQSQPLACAGAEEAVQVWEHFQEDSAITSPLHITSQTWSVPRALLWSSVVYRPSDPAPHPQCLQGLCSGGKLETPRWVAA